MLFDRIIIVIWYNFNSFSPKLKWIESDEKARALIFPMRNKKWLIIFWLIYQLNDFYLPVRKLNSLIKLHWTLKYLYQANPTILDFM